MVRWYNGRVVGRGGMEKHYLYLDVSRCWEAWLELVEELACVGAWAKKWWLMGGGS